MYLEGDNLHMMKGSIYGMTVVLFLELNPPGSLVGIRNEMVWLMVAV